jgi:TetR/AcrR family transcriptional regulator of autoinduction and epiphytic fitness
VEKRQFVNQPEHRTKADGRVLRGQRNTQAILDGLLALYNQGNLTPTITQVAEQAGVTTRAVYHRFPDLDAIAHAVGQRHFERYRERYIAEPSVTGSRDERIAALVAKRADIFETVAPVRRSAVANLHRSATIQSQLRFLSSLARNHVEQAFREELDALDPVRRLALLESLDLIASWESWERLRGRQGLTVDSAKAVMSRLLRAVLADGSSSFEPSSDPIERRT